MAREIGTDPVSGKPVSVRYGRYGAFAQIGTRDDAEKPKFASLRPHQRMDTITLAEALELFKLPREVGQMPDGHPIRIAIGRFGPYVQFGAKKYASLKHDDPYTVTRERALEVIAEKELRDGTSGAEAHRWATLGGPTCDSTDVIARETLLPELAVGDLLVSPVMGAYTSVTATRFNGRALTPIAVMGRGLVTGEVTAVGASDPRAVSIV